MATLYSWIIHSSAPLLPPVGPFEYSAKLIYIYFVKMLANLMMKDDFERKDNYFISIHLSPCRFAPALAVLTAFEFLWPLAGNGPIFSRVANFILNKCTKNWWLNLLFINNALDAIDIVSTCTRTITTTGRVNYFFFSTKIFIYQI